MPLFLHAPLAAPESSVTLLHLEKVKGSWAGGGIGRRVCVYVVGAVPASSAHLVVLKVSAKPGGHEAPECFQSPCSHRPHLDQEA